MKLLDRCLFIYSVVFSLCLLLGALFTGFIGKNPLVLSLFLPVILYFIYVVVRSLYIKKLRREYYQTHPTLNPNPHHYHPQPKLLPGTSLRFCPNRFITQKNPVFLLTLGLYSLAIALTLWKISLNFIPQPEFTSPLPQTINTK